MCALHIGSFGYEVSDVEYKWAKTPVSYSKFEMAQFKLMDTGYCEVFETGSRKKTRGPYSRDASQEYRNDSIASLEIMLERQTGYFLLGVNTNQMYLPSWSCIIVLLLQIYMPLTMVVFCSWVTFFLIKTEKGGEVPARTALGANSILSIVNIGFGGKSR